jgi:hypothetical protein
VESRGARGERREIWKSGGGLGAWVDEVLCKYDCAAAPGARLDVRLHMVYTHTHTHTHTDERGVCNQMIGAALCTLISLAVTLEDLVTVCMCVEREASRRGRGDRERVVGD